MEERTLPHLIREKAERNRNKTCLLFEGLSTSYSELHRVSNKVANSLLELGVGKGDKVSILMTNRNEYIYAWIGLAKIGAVEVPIYPDFRGEMLAYRLDYSDSKVLITEPDFLDSISEIQTKIAKIQKIIVVPDLPSGGAPLGRVEAIPFGRLLNGSSQDVDLGIKPSDPFAIMFTSGTTGPPKGAVLPHGWYFHSATNKMNVMRTGPDDVIFNCFPLCNPTGQLETTLTAIVSDATVAHVKRFSASSFWKQCREFGATEFVYMGGILTLLLKQPESELDQAHGVRAAWGAGCAKQVWSDFENRFGVKIIEIYGTTETMQTHQTPWDLPRPGSIGKAVENWEAAIVDENDVVLPKNQLGEIVARPRQADMMFLEYYKDIKSTAEKLRNSWFHTGDLGNIDDDGYFHFSQRKKYAMRIKGRMVSSWEVEQEINTHPKVKESVAFGVPSDRGEEECKAIVVIKPGEDLRPEELVSYCESRLPDYMIPRFFEITRTELKKTHTERVVVWEYQGLGVGDSWDRERAGRRSKNRGESSRKIKADSK